MSVIILYTMDSLPESAPVVDPTIEMPPAVHDVPPPPPPPAEETIPSVVVVDNVLPPPPHFPTEEICEIIFKNEIIDSSITCPLIPSTDVCLPYKLALLNHLSGKLSPVDETFIVSICTDVSHVVLQKIHDFIEPKKNEQDFDVSSLVLYLNQNISFHKRTNIVLVIKYIITSFLENKILQSKSVDVTLETMNNALHLLECNLPSKHMGCFAYLCLFFK